MDVERIQKINALALDLMKKGLAQNREDAVTQAERVYRNQDSGGYSDIRNTMQQVQAEGNKSTSQPDLPAEKVREILEQNTSFLVKKIKEFQEKITALENEVATLKTSRASVVPAKPSSTPPPLGEIHVAPGPNTPVRGSSSGASASNHPRSGNYNEGDVSIEKFFYMGRK